MPDRIALTGSKKVVLAGGVWVEGDVADLGANSLSRALGVPVVGRSRPLEACVYELIEWYDILYCFERKTMAITASEARKRLFPLIEQVNEDRTPVEITSKRGDAVLISIDDYRALEETAHLLRSPANVRRLLESLDQAHAGSVQEHELDR